jgi:hypothetical protein
MQGVAVGLDRVGNGVFVGVDEGNRDGGGVMLGSVVGGTGVSVGVSVGVEITSVATE